jgi:hypothetical protein
MNIFDPDAERLAQRLRHVDVEPPELRGRLVERTERQIISGQPDPQRAARDDIVEPGRLLGVGRRRHQRNHHGKAGQQLGHLTPSPASWFNTAPYEYQRGLQS